jgi:hypothetical protein
MKYTVMKEELEKLAAGDTTEIDATPQTKEDMSANMKVLANLFEHHEGLADKVKQELGNHFDLTDPRYALRKQSLIDKVAYQIKLASR